MNVNNLTMMEKLQLLQTAQLNNTDYVVIEGNNEDGWTLVNWNGKKFSPEPTFEHEVKLQFRTLSRQLTAAPMAQYLGLPIQVVPGLQEIEAGIYEGTPESDAVKGYLQAPLKWLQGDLDARIPG
nr:histidine phosphatase family protein [Streptomyces sp. DSM 41633]